MQPFLAHYTLFSVISSMGVVTLVTYFCRPAWLLRLRSKLHVNETPLLIFVPLIATATYLGISLFLYRNFETGALDLALYSQRAWQYGHFTFAENSFLTRIHPLADHFEPILFLVGQLSRFSSNVFLLLFFESAVVALGFIPLYLLGARVLNSKSAGFNIGISYLFSMGLLQAIAAPIHPGTWLPSCYALALYFAYSNRWKGYALALFVALCSKESAGLHFVGIALFIGLAWRQWKQAAITAVIGLVVLIFLTQYFLPAFAESNHYLHSKVFQSVPATPAKFIQFVLLHPADTLRVAFENSTKLESFLLIFGMTGFLALLSPTTLALFPFLIERLLVSDTLMQTMRYHYSAPIMVMVFAVTIMAILGLARRYPRRGMIPFLAGFVALCSICLMLKNQTYRSPLYLFYDSRYWERGHLDSSWDDIASVIPAKASLIGQGPLLSRVSQRQKVSLFGAADVNDFEFVLLSKDYRIASWPVDQEEVLSAIESLRRCSQYETVRENNSFILFKRRPWKIPMRLPS